MRYYVMRKHEIAPNVWGKPVSTGWTVTRSIAERTVDDLNDSEKYQGRRLRTNYFVDDAED